VVARAAPASGVLQRSWRTAQSTQIRHSPRRLPRPASGEHVRQVRTTRNSARSPMPGTGARHAVLARSRPAPLPANAVTAAHAPKEPSTPASTSLSSLSNLGSDRPGRTRCRFPTKQQRSLAMSMSVARERLLRRPDWGTDSPTHQRSFTSDTRAMPEGDSNPGTRIWYPFGTFSTPSGWRDSGQIPRR
jgi:hypothetical protein